VVSRPEVARRIQSEHAGAVDVFHAIETAIGDYLSAEMRLGRVPARTDIATLAFTVFASAHQLFFGDTGRPISADRLRQILVSLLEPA
jgi:hypothetical protein